MKNLSFLLLTVFILVSSACKKDEPSPDTGTEGIISGTVKLFDDAQIPMSKDGMAVSIYGSNPLISDTTDSNGKYQFKNVKYGTYSLIFTKPNYGIFILNNVFHQSEQTDVSITPSLGQISTTQVPSVSAKDSLGSVFIFVNTYPAANSDTARYIRIFFHTGDMVDFNNFTSYTNVLATNSNPVEYRLNPHKLEDMGFTSGETAWIKAYGDSYYSNAHIEPLKGKHIFPNLNLNSAAAKSFIVP